MEAVFRFDRLEGAVAVRRLNKFVVEAAAGGEVLRLHVRNTGRLPELLYPGARLLYEPRRGLRTAGVIIGVEVDDTAALIDPPTQVTVFEEAWRRGLISWLRGWRMVGRETPYRGSRIDYLLEGPGGAGGVMEAKSAVYLSEERLCMYPDTVSVRGRRHVEALSAARSEGLRAVIVFVAAHPLCRGFRPCCEIDPTLCDMLKKAREEGVEVRAVKMHLEDGDVLLDSPDLPVELV